MPETKKKVVPLSERETIITYNDAGLCGVPEKQIRPEC